MPKTAWVLHLSHVMVRKSCNVIRIPCSLAPPVLLEKPPQNPKLCAGLKVPDEWCGNIFVSHLNQTFIFFLLTPASLLILFASGYGVGVEVEWSEGGNDTRRACGSEKGPQGVDPPPPREIRPERTPCSSHTCHIPPRLLCHGHSLWGCYHQGVYMLRSRVHSLTYKFY